MELIVTQNITLPEPFAIHNILSQDAEELKEGQLLNRRTLIIDAETGQAWVFHLGGLLEETSLADYIDRIDTSDGKVSTIKIANAVYTWNKDILGPNDGILPLAKEYDPELFRVEKSDGIPKSGKEN